MGACSSGLKRKQADLLVVDGPGQQQSPLYKVVIVGEAGVGKTSVLLRFTDGTFNDQSVNLGYDFRTKDVKLKTGVVTLQLWDTVGQERYKTMTSSFYRGANGVILLYDITNNQSFSQVTWWLRDIERFVEEEVPRILVGNKADLQATRVVDKTQAENFAKQLGVVYTEISAKDGTNVDLLFSMLSDAIYKSCKLVD